MPSILLIVCHSLTLGSQWASLTQATLTRKLFHARVHDPDLEDKVAAVVKDADMHGPVCHLGVEL